MSFIRDEKLAYTNGLEPTGEKVQFYATTLDVARYNRPVSIRFQGRKWSDCKWRVTVTADYAPTQDFSGAADSVSDLAYVWLYYLQLFEDFFSRAKSDRFDEFPWPKDFTWNSAGDF